MIEGRLSGSPVPPELAHIYPFHHHYLEVEGGHRLHHIDTGEGDPVLMLHGNPTWSWYYRDLAMSLRERFRCVVPDHIGCGLSDKPRRYPYRLENHISNVVSLIEKLELQSFDLIVHDWGGAIGMGVATRMPERVKRIVVMNTAAFRSKKIPLRLRLCRLPVASKVMIQGFNGFARPATWMAVTKKMDRSVKAGYLLPYKGWGNRIATYKFVQDIPMSKGHPSHQTLVDIEEGLPKLKNKPMLICWGMKDFVFTPHFLEGWKERFPEAEVHAFEDAGHYVIEDEREQVIRLINGFL